MTLYRAVCLVLAAGSLCAVACSSGDGGGQASGGSSGAGGTSAKGGSSSKAGSTNKGGSSTEPVTCEDYGYVTNGVACPQTGCAAFSCECPDDFPISLASCTPDGCLLAADCEVLCAERLEGGFECTDTYTVDPSLVPGAGGSGGGGGSGGSGGMLPAAMCEASFVAQPPQAIKVLPAGADSTRLLNDASGNVYVAGVVPAMAAADFGGGELPAGKRLFLVKYDAQGQHVWSKRFGSMYGLETVASFVFAPDGTLLVGGITPTDTDLGGGPEPTAMVAQLYAARYDLDGEFLGSYLLPTSNEVPHLAGVAQMPNGEVNFWGDFSADFKVGETTLSSQGEADIFFVRFSAAGQILEGKSFGDKRNDLLFDVVVDASGNTYLAGFSFYQVDFGSSPIELGDKSSSFVVRLNSAQVPVWQELIGGGGSYPRRALLHDDELVVAGDSYSEIWYGDSTSGALPEGGVYVLRLDTADGSLAAGNAYGAQDDQARVSALSLLPGAGLAVGGYALPPADFGGGVLSGGVGSEPFVLVLDGAGAHQWSTFFCSTAKADVTGLGSNGDGPLVLVDYVQDLTLGEEPALMGNGAALLEMPAEP